MAALRFRYATPTASHGAGGNHALTNYTDHSVGAGHIHDPSIPGPFADYAKSVMPANVEFRTIDAHFNDDAFADVIIAKARELLAK